MRRPAALLPALLSALLLAMAAPAAGAAGVDWFDGDLAAAQDRAIAEGRLVLLDCWADWCKFCRVMDQDVWPDQGLARRLAREVVPLRVEVDVPRGVGLDIAGRYGVEELPLVLIIDPVTGATIERLEGFSSVERIEGALADAWKSSRTRSGDTLPEAATALRRARELTRRGQLREALDQARRARRKDASCAGGVGGDALLLIADLQERLGRPGRGLEALRRANPSCASGPEFWRRRVELAAEAGGEEQRGQELEAWAGAGVGGVEASVAWGRWLRESGGDPGRSIAVLREAEAAHPHDARIPAELARSLAAAGQAEPALEAVARAIEIDPHDAELRELRLELTLDLRRRDGS